MLNTAAVTPMPTANATTASVDTNRARTTERNATFRSRSRRDSGGLLRPVRLGRGRGRLLQISPQILQHANRGDGHGIGPQGPVSQGDQPNATRMRRRAFVLGPAALGA